LASDERINTRIDFRSSGFRKYFKNTSWLFLERLFRLILSFVVNIYIIRYLGAEEFGLLSYALSYVGLFSALAALGLESLTVREIVQNPVEKANILGTVLALRLFGSGIMLLLIMISFLFIEESSGTILLIMIISAGPVFQSFWVVDSYNQAKVQVKLSTLVHISSLTVSAIIKILLMVFDASVIYFAAITSAEFLFSGIGFLISYQAQEKDFFRWKFRFDMGMKLLRDSWPLILSGVVISIYMKIGQVMISRMLSNTDVGYYAAAVRLSEAWYFIPMAIASSLFPAIVNYKKINEELYLNRLQKLYDLLTWTAIAIAVPVSFFSEEIILLLLGEEYLASAPVLVIYIWAGIATFLGVASSQYLIAENLTKMSFYRTLIGMIANVILNFILIPKYGITGSAVATLISYSAATFSIGLSRKTYYQVIMMFRSILFINLFKFVIKLWQSLFSKK
jgi:O-antigen/teichoic acid export membrane protein